MLILDPTTFCNKESKWKVCNFCKRQALSSLWNIQKTKARLFVAFNINYSSELQQKYVFLSNSNSRLYILLFLLIYNHLLIQLNFQTMYNITDFHIENGLIPSFIPPGKFLLELIFYIKKNSTFLEYNHINVYCKIQIR